MAAALIVVAAVLLSAGAGLAASPLGPFVAAGVACLVAGGLAMAFGLDAARDVVEEPQEAEVTGG